MQKEKEKDRPEKPSRRPPLSTDSVDRMAEEVKARFEKVSRMDIFSRWKVSTCTAQLKAAQARAKTMVPKLQQEIAGLRKQVAAFLQLGHWEKARWKCESVLAVQAKHDMFEILDSLCDVLLHRMPEIDQQRQAPQDLEAAMASVIFLRSFVKEAREELDEVRRMFRLKYGSRWLEGVEAQAGVLVHERLWQCALFDGPTKSQIRGCVADVLTDFELPLFGMIDDLERAFGPARCVSLKAETPKAPRRPSHGNGTPAMRGGLKALNLSDDSLSTEEPPETAENSAAEELDDEVVAATLTAFKPHPVARPGAIPATRNGRYMDESTPKAPSHGSDESVCRIPAPAS